MTTFLNNYIQDWLEESPTAINLLFILTWITNHPLVSILIFIFSLVIIGKIIKGLDKLLEITGLSVLKVVFNFTWKVVKSILMTIGRLTGWGWEKLFIKTNQPVDELAIALVESPPILPIKIDKQQRLRELQSRLEAINQEQNELLQEVSTLLSDEELVDTQDLVSEVTI